MEKKRSVMIKLECCKCHASWQSPGMWNDNFTKIISLIHHKCPQCSNWKKNIGFDITNNREASLLE